MYVAFDVKRNSEYLSSELGAKPQPLRTEKRLASDNAVGASGIVCLKPLRGK